jgi:hypothetical protein
MNYGTCLDGSDVLVFDGVLGVRVWGVSLDVSAQAITRAPNDDLSSLDGVLIMRAALIFSGSGPIVILTSHVSLEDPALLERLARKGIAKFIAFPLPEPVARKKYGVHFDIVCRDLRETDDLRVLDFNGHRAMELLPLSELGEPILHEGTKTT